MRVFCQKWFNFTQVVFCISHCFSKTLRNIMLSLHGLQNSHIVLPQENAPMGTPITSSAFLNYRDCKQCWSLPVLVALLQGQTDGWYVVPSHGVKVVWISVCPSKAAFWGAILGEQYLHLPPLWQLLPLVKCEIAPQVPWQLEMVKSFLQKPSVFEDLVSMN